MLMTASCGFIQLYFPCGMYKPSQRLSKPPGFYRHMILVGCFRLVLKFSLMCYGKHTLTLWLKGFFKNLEPN